MATNANRARRPRMAVAEDTSDDAPQVLSLVSSKTRKVELRDVFQIDGVMHQIRTSAPLNVSLRYLHLARTQGYGVANEFMLSALLTPTAYQALTDYEDLTEAQLNQVITIAAEIMNGKVEKIPN